MNELSLFSGAGGGLLGSKLLGWTTVGYVEFNTYCQRVIAQRIEDGIFDEAPIFGDIDGFIGSGAAKKYKGFVDVLTAGFPCQPFSVAGKKKGQDDERNKWPQTIQCIRDVRPRYAFLENVPGLLNSGYFGEILSSLAEAGFDARWCVLGADDTGAPHRRKRLWILAYPNSGRCWSERFREGVDGIQGGRQNDRGTSAKSGDVADSNSINERARQRPKQSTGHPSGQRSGYSGEDVADSDGTRLQGLWRQSKPLSPRTTERPAGDSRQEGRSNRWPAEPDIRRVAHGVAHRVDRLKALGNGQVPRVAATAWRMLSDSNS